MEVSIASRMQTNLTNWRNPLDAESSASMGRVAAAEVGYAVNAVFAAIETVVNTALSILGSLYGLLRGDYTMAQSSFERTKSSLFTITWALANLFANPMNRNQALTTNEAEARGNAMRMLGMADAKV